MLKIDMPVYWVKTTKVLYHHNSVIDKWLILGEEDISKAIEKAHAAFFPVYHFSVHPGKTIPMFPAVSIGTFNTKGCRSKQYPDGLQNSFPLYFVRYRLHNIFLDYLIFESGGLEEAKEKAQIMGDRLWTPMPQVIIVRQLQEQNSNGLYWLSAHLEEVNND